VAELDPTGGIKRILVPADGSAASLEAVALACNIAKRNKGKVFVVHVIEVKRALPLDADLTPEATEGEQVLTEAERVADEQGFEIEGQLLQAREASHAVVGEAIEQNADAIIMGVEYKRPLGEFQLGRLPQYVLKNAPCTVWICRRRPQE
jgi:nucleotide-binding universal stress UspA family protein